MGDGAQASGAGAIGATVVAALVIAVTVWATIGPAPHRSVLAAKAAAR